MAKARETTAYQIGLIVSIVLTIILGVTTFIFYKAEEEAVKSRNVAITEKDEFEEKTKEIQAKINTLKSVVGKQSDPADPVETIMTEFEADQNKFAETYPNNGAVDPLAANYPEMLKFLTLANKQLHEQFAKQKSDVETIKTGHKNTVDEKDQEIVVLREQFQDQANQIKEKHEEYDKGLKEHLVAQEDNDKKIEESLKRKDEDLKGKNEQIAIRNDLIETQDTTLKSAISELEKSREVNLEAPDGEVIWVNQPSRTVYINLGYGDGLRRQTTFSVYGDDVVNAVGAEPKGTIEVIRIDEPHLSVAKIKSDKFEPAYDGSKDPIVKGDRLISAIFHRGRPERFAISGFIDIDGDGADDLEMLISLIKRNGGLVDAFVDSEGNRMGKLSSQTKFLVVGTPPNEKSSEKLMDAHGKITKTAKQSGVKELGLKDLLNYMGYTGREGSIGLGRRAKPEDFLPGKDKGSSPFRRRPSS